VTDVWSFAVVIWELFTLGVPYFLLSTDSMVIDFVRRGYQLQKPFYCDENLWKVVKKCFNMNPATRPRFKELVNKIEKILDKRVIDEQILLRETEDPNFSPAVVIDSDLKDRGC